MSQKIDPDSASGLDYYPLITPGERFPVNDPALPPRLEPHPADDIRFFHGLLERIARIEQRGYQLLEQLGAPRPTTVRSNGSGAGNIVWRQIRTRVLGIEIIEAASEQAAYGSALLAQQGISS